MVGISVQGASLLSAGAGTEGGVNSVLQIHLTRAGGHFAGDTNSNNILDPGESVNVQLTFAVYSSGPFRLQLAPEAHAVSS
jgi:hypothetical protein